jgi:hypothetical protein
VAVGMEARKLGRLVQRVGVLLVVAGMILACASPQSTPARSFVPIRDIGAVVGKWAGIATRSPAQRQDDWVELTINADRSYEAKSARQIGMFTGNGTLDLRDGAMFSETDRAKATYRLYQSTDGSRILVVEVDMGDGRRYGVELKPAR